MHPMAQAMLMASAELPHRYWRLLISDNNTAANNIAALDEVQFHTAVNGFGADALTSGTASADTILSGTFLADGATDGFLVDAAANVWASTDTAFTHWWKWDFGVGVSVNVTGVSILARAAASADQMPRDFAVQWSNDNTNWTTKWSESGITFTGYQMRQFFWSSSLATGYTGSPHGSWQHWRIKPVLDNGGTISSAVEIEMRATPGGANLCTGGTVIADGSINGTNLPAHAFDGNSSTFFASNLTTSDPWIGYSFAAPTEVSQILWKNRNDGSANQAPLSYVVQYASSASGPWTMAWSVTGLATWALNETRIYADTFYRTAPVITSASTYDAEDDVVLARILAATVYINNETITWSIVGGADAAQFEFSGSTLRWSSNGTRDLSAPADANADNVYLVTVRATSSITGMTADQNITVTVIASLTRPSYVNVSTQLSVTASGITLNLPGSRVNGNLLVGVLYVNTPSSADVTWPAGWTKIDTVGGSSVPCASWAFRYVTGSETAPTVNWTGTAVSGGVIFQLTGTHASAPIGHTTKNFQSGGTVVTCAEVVPTANYSLAFLVVAQGDTFSPSGWTFRFEVNVGQKQQGKDQSMGIAGLGTGAISATTTGFANVRCLMAEFKRP